MSQTPEAYTINNEQEAIRELEIMRRCFKSFSVQFQALSMAIKALAIPSAEPYKGMTNGEVLEAVFPNIDFCIKEFDDSIWVDMEDIASFRLDWWNSPYEPQERSEDR